MKVKEKRYLVTNFSNFANNRWQIVNDGVMGGFSRSHLKIQPNGNAIFLGELITDHNGGFASVKNSHSLNLDGYDTFILRVKGDGKQYSLRFKTARNKQIDYWSYESRFWTLSGQWQTIELPINDFYPVYRGKRLKGIPDPILSNIREYGLLVSNRQEGEFRIEIESLEVTNKNRPV